MISVPESYNLIINNKSGPYHFINGTATVFRGIYKGFSRFWRDWESLLSVSVTYQLALVKL